MITLASNYIVQLSVWGALSFYFIALVPQIILNYRLKSADGLSDLYLWAFFNGYVAEVFYVFFVCLLPTGYLCHWVLFAS